MSDSIEHVQTSVPKSLKVEIHFPAITNLKQEIQSDKDGNLMLAVQFVAPLDQFELFRLANLLKQPHDTLFALIGSNQSAMDFTFDKAAGKIDVVKASPALAAAAIAEPSGKTITGGKIAAFALFNDNFSDKDALPYGVYCEYRTAEAGFDSIPTPVAARGMSPTEAVIALLKQIEAVPADVVEPLDVIEYIASAFEKTAAVKKLLFVLETNSFDYPADLTAIPQDAPQEPEPNQAPAEDGEPVPTEDPPKRKRKKTAEDSNQGAD